MNFAASLELIYMSSEYNSRYVGLVKIYFFFFIFFFNNNFEPSSTEGTTRVSRCERSLRCHKNPITESSLQTTPSWQMIKRSNFPVENHRIRNPIAESKILAEKSHNESPEFITSVKQNKQ